MLIWFYIGISIGIKNKGNLPMKNATYFIIISLLISCANYFQSPQEYLKSNQYGLQQIKLAPPSDSIELYLFNDYKKFEGKTDLIWIDSKNLNELIHLKLKEKPETQVLFTFNDHSDFVNLFGFHYSNLNLEDVKMLYSNESYQSNKNGITFYYTFKNFEIVDSYLVSNQNLTRLLFINNPNNEKDPYGLHFKREVESLLFEYNDHLWSKNNPMEVFHSTSFGNYLKMLNTQEDSTAYGKQIKTSMYSFVHDAPMRNNMISKVFQYQNRKLIEIPENFEPRDAKEIILSKAIDSQVVMFNEDHSNPENRIFFADLLPELIKQGFTAIAFEALTYDEKAFVENVPTQHSGFYTWEPEFRNLLSKAKELNFEIFAYEDSTRNEFSGNKALNHRDSIQAENLIKIWKEHPKLLVYAGHGHIEEKHTSGWKKMAERFYELTEINPLTVEQAAFSNFGEGSRKHNREKEIAYPSVMLNELKEVWVGQKGFYDLQILFPKNQNWYTKKQNHYVVQNRKEYVGKIIQVYKKNDPIESIPVAIQLIHSTDEIHLRISDKGEFRYFILTENGQILDSGDFSL